MGDTLSVHPLVILVALTAGTALASIIGAILSVPLTAVACTGIKAWNAEVHVHSSELEDRTPGLLTTRSTTGHRSRH